MDTPLSTTRVAARNDGGEPVVTQWVEAVEGGRRRGPGGLALAWVEVLRRPRQFFAEGVAPGDQGPGLTFAVAVVLLAQGTRFAVGVDAYPVLGGRPVASGVFWTVAAAVLVAPLTLHVIAAGQTVLLAAGTDDRGGVSETVQVLAYAAAPCVLAGVPIPAVRVVAGTYAIVLYLVGLRAVHDLSIPRVVVLGIVPGIGAYGYGFRTISAVGDVAAAVGLG